ncbi:hypothetical protein FB446DRAFT_152810 [Lentinula raphanica]|nr:hypothetical protein FB446DRAFT_152810 [Lentinula raphanica]
MQRSFQFVCLILAFATFVVHPAPLTSVSSTPETSDVPRLQSLERRNDKQPSLVDVLLLEDKHGKHSEVSQILRASIPPEVQGDISRTLFGSQDSRWMEYIEFSGIPNQVLTRDRAILRTRVHTTHPTHLVPWMGQCKINNPGVLAIYSEENMNELLKARNSNSEVDLNSLAQQLGDCHM